MTYRIVRLNNNSDTIDLIKELSSVETFQQDVVDYFLNEKNIIVSIVHDIILYSNVTSIEKEVDNLLFYKEEQQFFDQVDFINNNTIVLNTSYNCDDDEDDYLLITK